MLSNAVKTVTQFDKSWSKYSWKQTEMFNNSIGMETSPESLKQISFLELHNSVLEKYIKMVKLVSEYVPFNEQNKSI